MLSKPYRRIVRPFSIERLAPHMREDNFPYMTPGSSGEKYLTDPDYAPGRIDAVRSCLTLERDLLRLFDYVEPANENLPVFSHRIYELLLRACTEVEANCKAILKSNGYSRAGSWNICDYHKINASSRLSDYELKMLVWHQEPRILCPFDCWSDGRDSPPWYRSYNTVKHDRHQEFAEASLENALNAIAAVRVVLFSQFWMNSFVARDSIAWHTTDGEWLSREDSIFALRPPRTWTDDERYDFEWSDLRGSPDRFDNYPF